MSERDVDDQFHRAVDIVQSLPKGGPVQTSYEEKLCLYSLYKQATEGDIRMPRPGMLDMLGRAKWDSWHKQKGTGKLEAKRLYVSALLKILRKYDSTATRDYIAEIESFDAHRPASPSSSSSSYHSSQASPPDQSPAPPHYHQYLPPDPRLPIPDVAPDIVPPSALNQSHRSLLSLLNASSQADQPVSRGTALPGSRAHSLRSEGRKDPMYNLRVNRQTPSGHSPGSRGDPQGSTSRPWTPLLPAVRDYGPPDVSASPYFPPHPLATPQYPLPPPSVSTFAPMPAPSIPQTLQQIQMSLTALHERLSTLERTQAVLLRREERRRSWKLFSWADEGDDLDEDEDEAYRARWAETNTTTATSTRRKVKASLTLRIVWRLITAVRRAMLDLGVGMVIAVVVVVALSGGWRRGRQSLSRIMLRARGFIESG